MFMIDQYVFGTILVLSSFARISAKYLSLDSRISELNEYLGPL